MGATRSNGSSSSTATRGIIPSTPARVHMPRQSSRGHGVQCTDAYTHAYTHVYAHVYTHVYTCLHSCRCTCLHACPMHTFLCAYGGHAIHLEFVLNRVRHIYQVRPARIQRMHTSSHSRTHRRMRTCLCAWVRAPMHGANVCYGILVMAC